LETEKIKVLIPSSHISNFCFPRSRDVEREENAALSFYIRCDAMTWTTIRLWNMTDTLRIYSKQKISHVHSKICTRKRGDGQRASHHSIFQVKRRSDGQKESSATASGSILLDLKNWKQRREIVDNRMIHMYCDFIHPYSLQPILPCFIISQSCIALKLFLGEQEKQNLS